MTTITHEIELAAPYRFTVQAWENAPATVRATCATRLTEAAHATAPAGATVEIVGDVTVTETEREGAFPGTVLVLASLPTRVTVKA